MLGDREAKSVDPRTKENPVQPQTLLVENLVTDGMTAASDTPWPAVRSLETT
jgi:hypothetical protein